MDDTQTAIFNQYLPLANALAAKQFGKFSGYYSLDELQGICYLALVEAVGRWSTYCLENGYSPDNTAYLKTYICKHILGAIKDRQRRDDPLGRHERKRLSASLISDPTATRPPDSYPPTSLDGLLASASSSASPASSASSAAILDVYLSASSPNDPNHDSTYFKQIADIALSTYLSLPPFYQTALAFRTFKSVHAKSTINPLQMSTLVQYTAGVASDHICHAVITFMDPQPPIVNPQPTPISTHATRRARNPTNTAEEKYVLATYSQLVPQFIEALTASPDVLIDLLSRRNYFLATPSSAPSTSLPPELEDALSRYIQQTPSPKSASAAPSASSPASPSTKSTPLKSVKSVHLEAIDETHPPQTCVVCLIVKPQSLFYQQSYVSKSTHTRTFDKTCKECRNRRNRSWKVPFKDDLTYSS